MWNLEGKSRYMNKELYRGKIRKCEWGVSDGNFGYINVESCKLKILNTRMQKIRREIWDMKSKK
jgi:hypothetical protein